MANGQTRLIADVFDMVFFQGTEVAYTSDTLTDTNIDIKVSEKEVRGGKGNGIIATLHSGRDITVKVTDPVAKLSTVALQLGQDIVTGAGIGYCMVQKKTVKTVESALQITLDKTPLVPANVQIEFQGTKLTYTTDYTVTGTVVAFVGSKVKAEDNVSVLPYTYTSDVTSERISIQADVYAKGGKLVLQTIEIDETETPIANLFYVFANAIPTGNITIATKSERDANASDFELKVIKPSDSDEVGYILREPIIAV